MRTISVAAAALAVGACATAPPAPARLAEIGPVALIARVEAAPVSRFYAGGAADDADRRLAGLVAARERLFETELRIRGEVLDGFGGRPPFRVVAPGTVEHLRGSLLIRDEGPPDYGPLARAGIGGVLEVAVERVELVAASGDRPAGLSVRVRTRLVDLREGEVLWSREHRLEPRPGGPLAIDPGAPAAELAEAYLAALAGAAREVGRETARAFAAADARP